MRKQGARIANVEVGHGQPPTDEAVRQAANSPTARVQRAAYIREEVIENYLRKKVRIRRDRCQIEKFTSPGRRGVPDELITWGHPLCMMELIETKPPKGYDLQIEQKRDHARRAKFGIKVHTLYTEADVDEYFRVHDHLMKLT